MTGRERPYFMAHPRGTEPPDRLREDVAAVAIAIALLLLIVFLSSVIPA